MKSHTFDKELRTVLGKTMYDEEMKLIRELVESEHENVCFEYEMIVLAKNAFATLSKHVRHEHLPVKLKQRKNLLYALKEVGTNGTH